MILRDKGIEDHTPVFVYNQDIAQIQSYKYLGVYIDKSLTWDMHVHWVCEGLSQRLYFLRRLWFDGVDSKIILLFYQSVLESVIRYGLSTWYGNLNVKSKTTIQGIVRTAMKLTGQKDDPSIQSLFEHCTLKAVKRI